MSEKLYTSIAGVVFLLIAVGHLLRVVFGASFVVDDTPVPMWASVAAVIFMGFLSYEGFHLARKVAPRVQGEGKRPFVG